MAGARPDRAGSVSVVALALVLPLAASPFATDTTFATRLLVGTIGIAMAAVAPSRSGLPYAVRWALVGCAAVFAIAAAAGSTPALSLVGRYPRYEGIVTVIGYAGALFAGARLFGPGQGSRRRLFLSASSLAAIAMAGTAVLQVLLQPDERVVGMLGNSTVLGTWGAIIACMLSWHLVERLRGLWIAGLAGSLLTVLLSASRGAMAAVTIALLAAAALRGWRRALPMLGLAGALGVAAWLLPSVRGRLTGTTTFADATVAGRMELWSDTTGLVAANPLLGVGPSRFVDAIGPFHTSRWAEVVGPYAPPDSPHSLPLQVLASTGIAGLAALIGLGVAVSIALAHRRPWDNWTTGAVLATLATTISYLFSFTEPVTTTIALVCLGGAIAQDRPDRLRWPAATIGWIWVTAATFLAGTALVAESGLSAALTRPGVTTDQVLAVAAVRPWDADLTRRIGYATARLAERGLVDPASAVPVVADACQRLVASVECLQVLGDLEALAGDPAASVRSLDRALSIDPTNVDTLLKRGIGNAEAGDPTAAERDFLTAAGLRPTAAEPWDDLSTLYQRQGRTADATRAAEKAAEIRRR